MLVLHFVPGVMHTFVWIIGLLLFVASSILIALCVLLTLHFFYEAVVLKRCMQSRAPRAAKEPAAKESAADEEPDSEEPAAEEPAAEEPAAVSPTPDSHRPSACNAPGACVTCTSCDIQVHPDVKECPICRGQLSSPNSESGHTPRCNQLSTYVDDCENDEQCTREQNHAGGCLFPYTNEGYDNEFETELEKESSEDKIAGTPDQNETVESFGGKVQWTLQQQAKTLEDMCEFFFSSRLFATCSDILRNLSAGNNVKLFWNNSGCMSSSCKKNAQATLP